MNSIYNIPMDELGQQQQEVENDMKHDYAEVRRSLKTHEKLMTQPPGDTLTPKTNALQFVAGSTGSLTLVVLAKDYARLERELAAALAQVESLRRADEINKINCQVGAETLRKAYEERDEARQQFADERARLHAARKALERIAKGENAPDIDIGGELQFGLHCGVEDRGCSDQYEGADYGYANGVERTLEWAINEARAALEATKGPQ